jgi:hypothetical protein
MNAICELVEFAVSYDTDMQQSHPNSIQEASRHASPQTAWTGTARPNDMENNGELAVTRAADRSSNESAMTLRALRLGQGRRCCARMLHYDLNMAVKERFRARRGGDPLRGAGAPSSSRPA